MDPLLAVAGLVAVAGITPGPNNLVVMRAAASSGISGALPAIAGVVFGSLALLALVAAGGGALFSAFPASRLVLAFAGCGYLAWMGGRMVLLTIRRASAEEAPSALPPRVGGVAWFQFVNPKAWMMAITAVAGLPSESVFHRLLQLAPVFVVLPVVCLLLWASLGVAIQRALREATARAWFDRILGAVLVVSAVLLLSEV